MSSMHTCTQKAFCLDGRRTALVLPVADLLRLGGQEVDGCQQCRDEPCPALRCPSTPAKCFSNPFRCGSITNEWKYRPPSSLIRWRPWEQVEETNCPDAQVFAYLLGPQDGRVNLLHLLCDGVAHQAVAVVVLGHHFFQPFPRPPGHQLQESRAHFVKGVQQGFAALSFLL